MAHGPCFLRLIQNRLAPLAARLGWALNLQPFRCSPSSSPPIFQLVHQPTRLSPPSPHCIDSSPLSRDRQAQPFRIPLSLRDLAFDPGTRATLSLFIPTSPAPARRGHSTFTPITMSAEEDLIDYSDDELNNEAAAPAANGKKGDAVAAGQNVDKKGSYVGIHSTGFRDFLLKPELLRAIADCGFEHPSEG